MDLQSASTLKAWVNVLSGTSSQFPNLTMNTILTKLQLNSVA